MNTVPEVLSRMEQDILLRGYAESTKSAYLRYATAFLLQADKPIEQLDEEDIRKYLTILLEEKKLTNGSINNHNAALRFLFDVTLGNFLNHRMIPRLRGSKHLPELLTKDEVRRIFENASTLRNKAMLMTIYGGGLRVSEVCRLRVSDIQSETMRIFVKDGKGSKDRYTVLSQANLAILRDYWNAYHPKHPEGWLFLCQNKSSHAGMKMIQDAFGKAVKLAGIKKASTIHHLRGSFATHLLEDGVDVFTIKRMLGHASLNTTLRYIYLTDFTSSVKSPLDSLPKKRGRKPNSGRGGAGNA